MRRLRRCRWLPTALVLAGCLVVAAGQGEAAEETQRFLDGLRERGLYDMALEYLEQMRASPLVDKEFRTAIDYEVGVTLIAASRTGRLASIRQEQLDQAHTSLQNFLRDNPEHPLAAGANTKLADLLVERGRIKAEQAAKPGRPTNEKEQLMEEARALYQEARQVLDGLEVKFLDAHREFPKVIDPKDTERIEAREQVRRDLLQARLALATVVYEIAQTYDPGSKGNEDNLSDAAEKYNELYTKYGTRLGGLYARMWEGRCYKELNDPKKAFAAFDDLLSQPDEPQAFRVMKNKALTLLLETAVATNEKARFEKAIEKYREWADTARGAEESSPDGLAIKYHTGEVFFNYAGSLQKNDDRQANLKEARILFKYVADRLGEYQRQAKTMLFREELAVEGEKLPEPENFAEARDRGKDALDQLQVPGITAEEAKRVRNEAIRYFRMAMSMKTAEVTAGDMNVIRYYLAYLYWMSGDLYEAAVVGEFLARRYSDGPTSRQASKIAMAAYATLFNEAMPDDRQFESQRMTDIAEYISRRWEGEPEADDARMMLIRAALGSGDLDKAQAYLDKIPKDSSRRGEAELVTGQSLWANYLQAAAKEEAERPGQDKLDEMVARAQATLENGIRQMRKAVDAGDEVSYTLLASGLSLAQIQIGAGEPKKALELLEDPKIGALTLVQNNHPVTNRERFREETYKAALRACVGSEELEKAEGVMTALEQLIQQGGDSGAGEKLTRIYISLGRELQKQLERLRNENKTAQLQKVSSAFEMFLDRIRSRPQGNTFNSLNWVAVTFFNLGEGFDLGGNGTSPEAESYYTKAAETYRDILAKCEKKELEFQPGAIISVKIRLATCLRQLGQRKAARDLLIEILKERNTMIDAQIEAALTYQDWGEVNPTAYMLAIRGSEKHKEIWGWGGIANRVARSPQHRAVFHKARYNLALCRYKLAAGKSGEQRKALLEQAKKDILIVQRLYPEMGGKQWYPQYDDLLKKVQRLLGESPLGLKAGAVTKAAAS